MSSSQLLRFVATKTRTIIEYGVLPLPRSLEDSKMRAFGYTTYIIEFRRLGIRNSVYVRLVLRPRTSTKVMLSESRAVGIAGIALA